MGRRACVTPCLETPCTADTHTNNPSTPKLSSAPDTPNSLVDQDVSIRSVLQFAHQHTQRADSQGMKLQAPAEGSGPPEDSIEDSSLPRGDVESLRESQTSAPSLSMQFPGAQLSTTDNVGIPTDGGRVSDSVSSRCIPSRASHTRYAHTNAPQTPATVPEIQAQTPQQLYPDTAALIRTNNEAAFPHDVSNLSIRDMFNENTSNHQDYYGVDDPTASWTYSDACAIPYGTDRHHTENDNRGMATPPSTLHTPVAPLCSPDEDSATGLPLPPPMITPSTPTAESVGGSVVTLASSTSSMQPQSARSKPVLYSAIGSLEDPNSTSFASWRDKKSWRNRPKIDFPSTHFLKPVNSVNCVTTQSHRPVSSSQAVSSSSRSKPTSRTSVQSSGPSHDTRSALSRNLQTTSTDSTPTTGSNLVHTSAAGSTSSANSIANGAVTKKSNLRTQKLKHAGTDREKAKTKKVSISSESTVPSKSRRHAKKPPELFRPSSDAYTPRMGKKDLKYKDPELRTPVQTSSSGLGTLQRPNFRDALRRVAMILQQHIAKIERRFESKMFDQTKDDDGLFVRSMKDEFSEEKFLTPTYKCTMVRVPMARAGMVYGLKQIRHVYEIPTEAEIYEFGHQLFKTVQLSSECSIVCLIYIERLMELAKVPLLASTWRPIFMCGLLLASKVWQDLSSWNIEFASVYPQYSLSAINRLEHTFLRMIKWELYISSSSYAKYYFALRSLTEKSDFRQRYNRMVGGVNCVQAAEARKIEQRSTQVKEEALLQLSRSWNG
jgi:hypothetical protein